jgi:hypothetical protein
MQNESLPFYRFEVCLLARSYQGLKKSTRLAGRKGGGGLAECMNRALVGQAASLLTRHLQSG